MDRKLAHTCASQLSFCEFADFQTFSTSKHDIVHVYAVCYLVQATKYNTQYTIYDSST